MNLKETIEARGVTTIAICRALKLSRPIINKRLADTDSFSVGELRKLQSFLHLTNEERDSIFFDDNVSK